MTLNITMRHIRGMIPTIDNDNATLSPSPSIIEYGYTSIQYSESEVRSASLEQRGVYYHRVSHMLCDQD